MKLFKVSNSLDHPIGACDQRKKNNGDKIKNKNKNKKMMGAVHFV